MTAGAKNPVADPRVLVSPLRVPAKFGAISCSDREEPLLIGPVAPTDRHMTTMANTGSQFTHIIAINPTADTYKADKIERNQEFIIVLHYKHNFTV